MKSIIFVPVGKGDPFEYYAQLKTIWPEPYGSCAAHASREDSHTGEIFYAMYYGMVVGITGVWCDDTVSKTDVYLRWSGVIPEFRKHGIGRAIINAMVEQCRKVWPDRERLIELVPDNEYGHELIPFFEKVGFVRDLDGTFPAGEAQDWPVHTYAFNLQGKTWKQ